MTIDEGRKPEGAPERSPKAGEGAPSGDGDIRFPNHKIQRLSAQQTRHYGHLALSGKTLRLISFDDCDQRCWACAWCGHDSGAHGRDVFRREVSCGRSRSGAASDSARCFVWASSSARRRGRSKSSGDAAAGAETIVGLRPSSLSAPAAARVLLSLIWGITTGCLSYAPKGKLPAGVCLIIIGTEGLAKTLRDDDFGRLWHNEA